MTVPSIQKTKDYGMFKKSRYNREVSQNHVDRIAEAIALDNMLHANPILVNNELEVISGQHRLAAAKKLGVDIYYIKGDYDDKFILTANQLQKGTSLSDMILFFCLKEGKKDYLLLDGYIKSTKLSAKALLSLLFGSLSKKISQILANGTFLLPADTATTDKLLRVYTRFVEFCQEKRITPYTMFKSGPFTAAFREIVLLPDFDEAIFFEKLANRWFEIRPQPNTEYWMKALLEIYNWKNRTPLVIPEDF